VAALAAALANLIDNPDLRASAGKVSRGIGQLHSADRCGKLFVDGALLALARRRGIVA
jgi:hypothetical protein